MGDRGGLLYRRRRHGLVSGIGSRNTQSSGRDGEASSGQDQNKPDLPERRR